MDSFDIFTLNPAQIFSLRAVLSDDNEFGTIVSATVNHPFIAVLGLSTVTIRILPVSDHHASIITNTVADLSRTLNHPAILKHIGVWKSSSNALWLVTERRTHVSTATLFDAVHSADIESIIAHIARSVLLILHTLHNHFHIAHDYLRPSTIFLSDNATISLSDAGLYGVLRDSLSSRRSFPGDKLWPMLTTSTASTQQPKFHSDIWDLGITLLTLVDGAASVSRLWRAGRKSPRLVNPSRWSSHFNSFLSLIFNSDNQNMPSISDLLSHRFVDGVSSTACRAAMMEYCKNKEDTNVDPHINDMIADLFRQNDAVVRVPLINIDDISTDMFHYDEWKGSDHTRPTVELSLVRIINRYKEKPLTRDVEDARGITRTLATLETFLDTVDMP